MSPLTKVFVMLLVICSLLNAAATVVYVNKEQLTEQDYQQMQAHNASLESRLNAAIQDASVAHAQLTSQGQLSAADAAAKQAALDDATGRLAAKDAEYQLVLRNQQMAEANNTQFQAQLSIALAANKQDAQALSDLRDANGKLVNSQAESDAALARQRQLAETYGRQVEYLGEQVKKAQDTIKSYSAVINANHLTVPAEQGTTYGGPSVSGVVQAKQAVNGVTYVTISVGSADSVQPGMEFRVVDTQAQPQQFLGILTITHADPNSAVGRLEAADELADRVKSGDEVKSEVQ